MHQLKLFTGNSNRNLAEEIASYLGISLGKATVSTFSDGEIFVKIEENVRGSDTFVMQSSSKPVNTNIMELLILIDALKRASAKEITAVIPYYGYSRQDRKDQPRVPITAKLVADLVAVAGAHRVLTIDLHAGQIQGFFNIPVDHLYASPVLLDYFKKKNFNNLTIVSPDAGGVERARAFAKRMNVGLAIIDKRREGPNRTKIMNIIGDVANRDILILDDMIDTAGTISQAAIAIKKKGANQIYASCTHAILSGPAMERLNDAPIEEVIVTNTVPPKGEGDLYRKIKVLSIASLLGEAINRIHKETSVSSLFV
ncbi:MAG: ribose-phosphate pyrophosphokinase [Nitrospira sp.]|nr:ribose-phosphate pyrophosphokinase [Candidatus Manganitrophaceae bacterium]HIL34957.1 ribose-phosphate pyrophosphokinase [Candidatus Manganitrophaceae bacterium]